MNYKIWHNPQVPGEAFEYNAKSPEDGMTMLHALAEYDLFLLRHEIRGDFSNASGLLVYEDGEWLDWYNDDGEGVWDIIESGQFKEVFVGNLLFPVMICPIKHRSEIQLSLLVMFHLYQRFLTEQGIVDESEFEDSHMIGWETADE